MLQSVKEERKVLSGNLLDVFQPYKMPYQDLTDPIDGQRFQQKSLGIACIQAGEKLLSHCAFFEVVESTEISESPEQEELVISDESSSLDGLASFALTKSLPPKKRKRRKMIRHDLVFTLDKQLDSFTHYYTFPREALTECLTTSAPHKVVLSFLPMHSKNQDCACVLEEGQFKTKLEEFAAVCSHSCQWTDPSIGERWVQNMLISNVSFELLQVMKQISNVYEIMCQNMMELMRLHHEKVTHHKSEIAIEKSNISQSEEDHPMHSSSDEQEVVVIEEEEEEETVIVKPKVKQTIPANTTKKCLYCGSKSTPMWRRGPQGAGTLCNACGVKWKHGKILNGADNTVQDAPSHRKTNKGEKKRKRSNASSQGSVGKRKSTADFAVPAPPQPTWDTTSSSTTSESSPLESSPNTSPLNKQDISSFISYNADTLSIYAGEDAVEAAALLTLLKRS